MKTVFSIFVFLLLAVAVDAQGADTSALAKTAGGRRVVDYFAAFNSGDESRLRAFFEQNISAVALRERSVETRVAFHRQVRSDYTTIAIRKIVSISDSEIRLFAQSVNGSWISYSFQFENDAAKKIGGFMIEPIDDPESGKTEPPPIPPPTNRAEFLKDTEQLLDKLAGTDAFSGVVLIAKDNSPIFEKAYGYADRSTKTANRIDTKFNLGSINKIFTRIAIGQLVQHGKLSFDDKLIKYLPDYPNRDAASKITIGELVNMTSGIGDFVGDKFWAMDRKKLLALNDFLPLFGDQSLQFEPGTANRYSNGGYIVLGLVIEKITGKSYYDYVRENIFGPAGMGDTDSYLTTQLPANSAIGYTRHGSATERGSNDFALPGRGSSAGGGYSTAPDLFKLSAALNAKKLLIPDDKGTFATEFTGTGIAGGSEGVNALFIANGKTGYTIIILSNLDPPSAEKPGEEIRGWLKQLTQ